MIKNFKWLLLVSLAFAACNNDDDDNIAPEAPLTAGNADFSKYVALGNSLTAGFSENALFRAGQENSYPYILSQQFALVGGGEFKIPYVEGNTGGLTLLGNVIQGPRLTIDGLIVMPATATNPNPTYIPNIVPFAGIPVNEIGTPLGGGPYNNMGVPGAKSFHLLAPGYGNVAGVPTGQANPYFVRFASSASASIIGDAEAQNATFFSLWIGNNDVLAYSTSGGVGANQLGNPDPTSYGPNDITDPAVFAGVYEQLVTRMTVNGAKGIVSNIPYVTSIPFFRTVPYNPVPLTAEVAAQLNAGYAGYNGGLNAALGANLITQAEADRRKITFQEGNNAVIIVDGYLTNLAALGLPSYRPATAEDLIVLSARTFIGTYVGGNPAAVNGVSVPLADNWVLSKDEVAEVKIATDAYNVSIKTIADEHDLAFVDANAILQQLYATGIRFGNYSLTASYVTGGAFSLDGVHPSARGYAYIANKFLEAINAKYGSNLKGVDIGKYSIQYPNNL